MIVVVVGAVGHELFATRVQPTLRAVRWARGQPTETYASYSESLKILCSSRSTETSNPASNRRLAVVGVKAARRSNSLVSQRSQRQVLDIVEGRLNFFSMTHSRDQIDRVF